MNGATEIDYYLERELERPEMRPAIREGDQCAKRAKKAVEMDPLQVIYFNNNTITQKTKQLLYFGRKQNSFIYY